jgi:hypothetical protein
MKELPLDLCIFNALALVHAGGMTLTKFKSWWW